MMGPFRKLDADDAGVGKKGDIDKRYEYDQPFYDLRGKEAIKKFKINVRSFSNTGYRSYKAQEYKEIPCYFLCPGEGAVQRISGKKLNKNNDEQCPKDDENWCVNPLDVGNVVQNFKVLIIIVHGGHMS